MALFSFRHSVKTFSPKCESASRSAKAGQTASHLQYITRSSAARAVVRERIGFSTDTEKATTAEQVAEKRKGRVCERFIIALPEEATEAERLALAVRFAEDLTQKKAGYVLAIHDKAGNDKNNPHFHLVAFDAHEATGGRGRPRSIIGMARKNAIERWAKHWAEIHNEMMTGWGYGADCLISNLSFADRGIDQIAEIHEGPASRKMKERGVELISKPEWKQIDAGHTRAEANDLIREINHMQETTNAANNRLGSRNAGNPKKGISSSPPFRTNRRMPFPDASRARSAVESAQRDKPNTTGNRQPHWLAESPTERFDDRDALVGHNRVETPLHAAPMRAEWPPLRNVRVRRVFLELKMLRDTLRARLATLGGRRLALPGSKVAREQPTLANFSLTKDTIER